MNQDSNSADDPEDDSGDSIDEDLQYALDHAPERKPPGGYFSADPDPTDADCSGLAVRLDVAVIAVRLTAWRVVTRLYPTTRKSRLKRWRDSVISIGSTIAGFIIAKEVVKKIVGWINTTLQIWDAVSSAQEAEKLLRGQCHVVRRQLLGMALQKAKGRRRKTVSTRHITRKNGR